MAEDTPRKPSRSDTISQHSHTSQTAQEFINSQLQLEADAREVLPYQFDTCSRPLGPLRQKAWSCLTCNPPPEDPSEPYTPAGVCYSCHVSCHGEHHLVELFAKRNFVCDCGTTRIQSDCPCTLRVNEDTGVKGGVRAESPAPSNHYDHNYRNRFCGCGQEYDAHQEKGTMFQCLGLGTIEDGGCGEDWWHPECLVGLPRDWYAKESNKKSEEHTDKDAKNDIGNGTAEKVDGETVTTNGIAIDVTNGNAADVGGRDEFPDQEDAADEDPPLPPSFPAEDLFEHLICYKCVEAFPWIKRYASAPGFLPPVYRSDRRDATSDEQVVTTNVEAASVSSAAVPAEESSKKRKASDAEDSDGDVDRAHEAAKRQRNSQEPAAATMLATSEAPGNPRSTQAICHYANLPPAPNGRFSLFLKEDFRDQICRCPSCFPLLTQHPYLLEEEDMYEPPVSESDEADAPGTGSAGSRSLLDRGEVALSNIDRVRAIEGVMVYNHLKDKVKDFLKPFAESGRPVGAEDIKAYFERLRGDDEGIMAARGDAERGGEGRKGNGDGDGNGGPTRDEQRGESWRNL
ncbi:metaphase-anaphase transition protein [Diplodia corticola]|uniref:Metaphase-anaphase transition protein n=1 Tax=Diplodia corticola TaxID=236234 RepID=A0A1J9R6I1_9PEZI|nr:metaphase-anaphase transition protein [Diplodia corticola]OJD37126.1 metaphase-anaphase transition protein [Diplodia corticola]